METKILLIRPVKTSDLDAICKISEAVGPGFTSLPNEPHVISQKITRSLESFAKTNSMEDRLFFFVLEDREEKCVIGTAVIEVDVNHNGSFYCYQRSDIVQQSHGFNDHPPIVKKNKLLVLDSHFPETSTYGTLYLHRNHRGKGYGKLLSRIRSLFIAVFPDLVYEKIIANMEGYFVDNQYSPFWNSVGSVFYNMDIREVNLNLSKYGSQFIGDLNPHFPIYEALLPKEVQEVIGKTNEVTRPALHVLEKEGFVISPFIDIFDGGPIVEVQRDNLKTVKDSRLVTVVGIKEKCESSVLRMVCNTLLEFRGTLGYVDFENQQLDKIFLEKRVGDLLNVSVGDPLRTCIF